MDLPLNTAAFDWVLKPQTHERKPNGVAFVWNEFELNSRLLLDSNNKIFMCFWRNSDWQNKPLYVVCTYCAELGFFSIWIRIVSCRTVVACLHNRIEPDIICGRGKSQLHCVRFVGKAPTSIRLGSPRQRAKSQFANLKVRSPTSRIPDRQSAVHRFTRADRRDRTIIIRRRIFNPLCNRHMLTEPEC